MAPTAIWPKVYKRLCWGGVHLKQLSEDISSCCDVDMLYTVWSQASSDLTNCAVWWNDTKAFKQGLHNIQLVIALYAVNKKKRKKKFFKVLTAVNEIFYLLSKNSSFYELYYGKISLIIKKKL